MLTNTNRSTLIKWIICLIVSMCIYLIPLSETYTASMRAFFVVTMFSILVMAFELLHTMAIAVLLPVLYMVFVAPTTTIFSGWMTTTPWVCLGAMLLANILNSCGVLNRISYFIVSKCGSYKAIVIGIFFIGVIVSFLTSVMGSLLVFTFAYGVAMGLGIQKSKEGAIIMMAAIFSTTTVEMFIYKPVFMSLINGQAALYIPDFAIEYLELLIANWPFIVVCILLLLIFIKMYDANIGNDVKSIYKQKLQELGPMTISEKKGAGLAIFIVLYMMTSSFTGFPMDYGLMIFPWLAFFPGMNIATDKEVRNIQFDMIFFMMACMSIGGVAAYVGVASWVSNMFVDIVAPMGGMVVMFVIYIFGILLNFLMTPMAMLASFLGPVIEIAQKVGINPDALIYIFYAACDQIILPYEYANYLLAYSFGMITLRQFIEMSLVKLVVVTIFIFTVMLGWWSFIGVL